MTDCARLMLRLAEAFGCGTGERCAEAVGPTCEQSPGAGAGCGAGACCATLRGAADCARLLRLTEAFGCGAGKSCAEELDAALDDD